MVCDGDNGILQIEDTLLIQQGNDFLILIGGRNREVAVNGFFGILQCIQHQLLCIFYKGFGDIFGFCFRDGREGLHEGKQGGIQIIIDAEQPDNLVLLPKNGGNRRFKGFAAFVFGKVGDVVHAGGCHHFIDKIQCNLGNGRTNLSAGKMPIHNFDNRSIQLCQVMNDDLAVFSQEFCQSVRRQHIGFQNGFFFFAQNCN